MTRKLRSAVCTSELPAGIEKFPGSMQTRRSRVYGQLWPVFGCGLGSGLGLELESGVGLGFRPYLVPTGTKIPEQHTNLKILSPRLYWDIMFDFPLVKSREV